MGFPDNEQRLIAMGLPLSEVHNIQDVIEEASPSSTASVLGKRTRSESDGDSETLTQLARQMTDASPTADITMTADCWASAVSTPSLPVNLAAASDCAAGAMELSPSAAMCTPRTVHVSVKTSCGLRLVVPVNLSGASVMQLKSQLAPLVGFGPTEQKLILKGRVLNDSQPLFSLGLCESSVVFCMKQKKQLISVMLRGVKLEGYDKIVSVKGAWTLTQLTDHLESSSLQIRSLNLQYFYNGHHLTDTSRSLYDYGVRDLATLYIVPRIQVVLEGVKKSGEPFKWDVTRPELCDHIVQKMIEHSNSKRRKLGMTASSSLLSSHSSAFQRFEESPPIIRPPPLVALPSNVMSVAARATINLNSNEANDINSPTSSASSLSAPSLARSSSCPEPSQTVTRDADSVKIHRSSTPRNTSTSSAAFVQSPAALARANPFVALLSRSFAGEAAVSTVEPSLALPAAVPTPKQAIEQPSCVPTFPMRTGRSFLPMMPSIRRSGASHRSAKSGSSVCAVDSKSKSKASAEQSLAAADKSDRLSSVKSEIMLETSNPPISSSSIHCQSCSKRVGLAALALKCKCGHAFCASHRMPEDHKCSYDYSGVHKAAVEKANPKVIAEKLHKI